MTDGRLTAHYAFRRSLRDALRADLLGPAGGPTEILSDDAPVTAYPIGVLFPQRTGEADGAEEVPAPPPDVVAGDDPEQSSPEPGVGLANRRRPSSMGLTFAVDPAVARSLTVAVTAAAYRPEDEHGNPVAPRRGQARSTDRQQERWRREPLDIPPIPLDIATPGSRVAEPAPALGLDLRILVRPPAADGTVTITLTLVNTEHTGAHDLQDAYCWYQPTMTVTGPPGTAPFVERRSARGSVDQEHALSRLLYRHAPVFAVGHGCAAVWNGDTFGSQPTPDGRAAVASVGTEFMPTHEVLPTDSNPGIDDRDLAMLALGRADRDALTGSLHRLLDGYQEWIGARAKDAAALTDSEHRNAAAGQLDLCREALARMRRGIELLADDQRPDVLTAFRLANLAMADQRARTSWIKSGRQGTPAPEEGRWRPFQIAFLLLCLEGIVDPDHADRARADLLWFPTGGGKTEAYLGLIAFTAFHRRLRDGAEGHGVTVLMRYTLRLLTLQQFERAASLICAMERIRVDRRDELGDEPFSIGMWVGSSATPNRLDRAREQLTRLVRAPRTSLQKENPVQLHTCPWCGTPLDASCYRVDDVATRMTVHCPDTSCAFSVGDGLPVHLIDEAVYRARPTLVIATVDKFASMPWRPATAALFNRDDGDDTRPPELIVQDELHLISGPLGTLTGLYETAVDILSDRPKVVASTATIRRASDQVAALFDRRVAQFPPAGLDARDSWFAVEVPRTEKASRRHIGLLTASTSQATLLVRTYAALLHHASRIDGSDHVRDAYWTLVGYFNSLRLLSAAELQVLDDVQDRLELLARRHSGNRRTAGRMVELSSRADSSEIPRRLKELELAYPHRDSLDVLLATNMIAVGVDIDRLGLMAVMGQPQTTAEYIQATSRVGRRHPGLITVMLNSTRSRDRSHYENFGGFHSALYREVESTSVTPFSARARDRGLHAVIVALVRLTIAGARDNRSAARVEDFVDEIETRVRPAVLERAAAVDREQVEHTAVAFDAFVEAWRDAAASYPDLVYEAARNSAAPALLSAFDGEDHDSAGRPTLWSLRDVDAESTLFLER